MLVDKLTNKTIFRNASIPIKSITNVFYVTGSTIPTRIKKMPEKYSLVEVSIANLNGAAHVQTSRKERETNEKWHDSRN